MKENFPQVSYDIYQNWGEDFNYSSQNDLLGITQLGKSQQRVLRRLLTNPGDYIWHSDYGAGLSQFVGLPLSPDVEGKIQAAILAQIFLEDTVAKVPIPQISLQTIQGGLFCQIEYTENSTQQPIVLTFNIQ